MSDEPERGSATNCRESCTSFPQGALGAVAERQRLRSSSPLRRLGKDYLMPDFTRQRSEVPDLVPTLESWALSSIPDEWKPGASDAEIAAAERILEREFPPSFRGIYQVTDGLSILHANLNFHPLRPAEKRLGLTNASDQLREWKWPIPEELVVFGDNGGDELFGLWLPGAAAGKASSPVVEVGEIFGRPDAFAVVGTDLCRFLRAWTAYYTLMYVQKETVEPEALDVLGVPNELREVAEEDLFPRLFAWADPDLPDPNPDPYGRGVTAEALRRTFGLRDRSKQPSSRRHD